MAEDFGRRECHNMACLRIFTAQKGNQKHCDKICANRCRICHRKYESAYYKRLSEKMRRTHRGLGGAIKLVEALHGVTGSATASSAE